MRFSGFMAGKIMESVNNQMNVQIKVQEDGDFFLHFFVFSCKVREQGEVTTRPCVSSNDRL